MTTSKHTILIICEGENTEPLFFNAIRDAIIEGHYHLQEVEITIKPEPVLARTDDEKEPESRHKKGRKKRELKRACVGSEPTEINQPLPLKWVLEAQQELAEGTYNEAWVVCDHDDHPARKEAFQAAAIEVNNRTVQIAFSSRTFEYYLLLHFERIFYRFSTSECKDKKNPLKNKRKKAIECGTDKHVDDCHGTKCIGGHARTKGYWSDSKANKSTFHLIKDKLQIGFENAAWLRGISDQEEANKEIFDRNPYITTDSIVKRLCGYESNQWIWLNTNQPTLIQEIQLIIHPDYKITITNKSKKNFHIKENSFTQIKQNNTRTPFGPTLFITPTETKELTIQNHTNSWFTLQFDNHHILMFNWE